MATAAPRTTHLPTALSGWLLIGALAIAPWAYGGMRPWANQLVNCLLGAAVSLWGSAWFSSKHRPQVPRLIVIGAGVLLIQAWWMTANAFTATQGNGSLSAGNQLLPGAPGSINQAQSLAASIDATMLLLTLTLASDLGRQAAWRKRFWWTIALTGTSIALFGLVQKLAGARNIFFAPFSFETETFFATFSYHANAGSYLNLVWPLVAGLTVLAFRKGTRAQRVGWTLALVTCVAALFVNTSRASGFLGIAMALPLCAWVGSQLLRGRFGKVHPAKAAITFLLLSALACGVAMTVGIDRTLQRWGYLERELTGRNLRLQAQQHELGFAADAGPFGFGPGTYPTVFATSERATDMLTGFKQFAHEDYLQTIIEWGFVGGLLWFFLLSAGPVDSLIVAWRNPHRWQFRDTALHRVTLLALLGVALHALVDYPMQVPSIRLYVVVMAGLLWSSKEWKTAREEG
jgi:O-Antigen ligase